MVYCKNKLLLLIISISLLITSSWVTASDVSMDITYLKTLHPAFSLSTETKAASLIPDEATTLLKRSEQKFQELWTLYYVDPHNISKKFLELKYEAEDLLQKSAERGSDLAQYFLGIKLLKEVKTLLERDQTTPKQKSLESFQKLIHVKRSKGLEWLIKAASQGDPELQYYLGEIYQLGTLIPLNIEQAHQWYKCAADQGYDAGQLKLACLYESYQLPPETYLELYAALAKKQDISPYFDLRAKYFNLISCSNDPEKEKEFYRQALKWFPETADQEIYEAQRNFVYFIRQSQSLDLVK